MGGGSGETRPERYGGTAKAPQIGDTVWVDGVGEARTETKGGKSGKQKMEALREAGQRSRRTQETKRPTGHPMAVVVAVGSGKD
jgi:hypothetical protein